MYWFLCLRVWWLGFTEGLGGLGMTYPDHRLSVLYDRGRALRQRLHGVK